MKCKSKVGAESTGENGESRMPLSLVRRNSSASMREKRSRSTDGFSARPNSSGALHRSPPTPPFPTTTDALDMISTPSSDEDFQPGGNSVDRMDHQVQVDRQQIDVKANGQCQRHVDNINGLQRSGDVAKPSQCKENPGTKRVEQDCSSAIPPPMNSLSPSCFYHRKLSEGTSFNCYSTLPRLPAGRTSETKTSASVCSTPQPFYKSTRENGGAVYGYTRQACNPQYASIHKIPDSKPEPKMAASISYSAQEEVASGSAFHSQLSFPRSHVSSPFLPVASNASSHPLRPVDDSALQLFNNQSLAQRSGPPACRMSSSVHTGMSLPAPHLHSFHGMSASMHAPSPSDLYTESSYYRYQSREVSSQAGSSQPHHHHLQTKSASLLQRQGSSMKENGSLMFGCQQDVAFESMESHIVTRNLDVLLHKVGDDCVGINVVRKTTGGISSIFVQDVIPGSLAERDGRLRKGDVLYSVNGRSLGEMSLLDAYQLFRTLPPGPIRIRAARHETAYVQRQAFV
ncbi:uncharacterized protein LOC112553889 isoform X2 [Pomacea canaliculata]|uniref:uncharacterized protein LOC112553889 isoform X2 n=1 Tax=Pomacea canaliculata TaxID=400727 RepID=UPI000D73FD32|nr:uncharacterized protein LOC112553889 isoform X2 [Pomacea canaliculata]XP_025077159.1 uncharacterized protein LOC112553889 isoform X2 [Pomacea canaliculata]